MNTPELFNLILETALAPTITKWNNEGIGYRINGHEAHHAIWADNIILIANTPEEAQRMINDVTQSIMDAEFEWKPTSLECMTTGELQDEVIDLYTWSNDDYQRIPQVKEITLLGTKLDQTGPQQPA